MLSAVGHVDYDELTAAIQASSRGCQTTDRLAQIDHRLCMVMEGQRATQKGQRPGPGGASPRQAASRTPPCSKLPHLRAWQTTWQVATHLLLSLTGTFKPPCCCWPFTPPINNTVMMINLCVMRCLTKKIFNGQTF